MKTYIILLIIVLLNTNCKGQNNNELKNKNSTNKSEYASKQPKGSWEVNKEFDENGNLIKYDSIYSWSSSSKYNDLNNMEKDSILQSLKSKFFKNYSHFENEGFDDIFSDDSLFSKHYFNNDFFNSDFGQDFMDIDKITEQMLAKQKALLEKYQSNFMEPENEN